MAAPSGPDYGEIAASYAFFLAHSSETDAQIAALAPLVAAAAQRGSMRLLDFGCGDGAFLARLLAGCAPATGISATLVEPAAGRRAQAAARLRRLPGLTVEALPELREEGPGFRLILANHSLYYVPDLRKAVSALCTRLAADGSIVVALLDRDNALARIWRQGYAELGMPFPFWLAEDAADALLAHGLRPQATPISYRIDLPDTGGARAHMLRFLFGPAIADRHGPRLQRLFDPYRQAARIVIETRYPHLVARAHLP